MLEKRIISTLIIFLLVATNFCIAQQKNIFPIWTFHVDSTNVHGLCIGAFSTMDHPVSHLTNGIKIEAIGVGLIMPLMPTTPIKRDSSSFKNLMNTPFQEKVNGLSISVSGSTNHSRINGILLSGIGQISSKVNGIAVCAAFNFIQSANGLLIAVSNDCYSLRGCEIGVHNAARVAKGFQVGGFNKTLTFSGFQLGASNFSEVSSGIQLGVINESEDHHGVQIGLYNKSNKGKGIQIGLWNVNQRRRMPFFNWNFFEEED